LTLGTSLSALQQHIGGTQIQQRSLTRLERLMLEYYAEKYNKNLGAIVRAMIREFATQASAP
jgi:hypothetical protein